MSEIEAGPLFYTIITPAGISLIAADPTPWPRHIGVSRDLVELADPEFLTSGDGMLRFTPAVGLSALYGYAHEDPTSYTPTFDHWDLIRMEP